MAKEEICECPKCHEPVPVTKINDHLDQCLQSEMPSSKRARKDEEDMEWTQTSQASVACTVCSTVVDAKDAQHSTSQTVVATSSSASVVPQPLEPYTRVRIRDLQSQLGLNSQEGVLMNYQAQNGHWKVRMADGAEKFVKAEKLEIVSEEKTSPVLRLSVLSGPAAEASGSAAAASGSAAGASESAVAACGAAAEFQALVAGSLPIVLPSADVSGEVTRAAAVTKMSDGVADELLRNLRSLHSSVDSAKTPQATSLLAKQVKEWEDLVSGSLESTDALKTTGDAAASFGAGEAEYLRDKERRTLAELQEALASTATQVAHWRNVVNEHAERSADALTTYQDLESPSSYEEQCERNRLRSELRRAVTDIMEALENIHQVAGVPGERLELSERSTLDEMDGAIRRFGQVREDARRHFEELRLRVRAGRDSTSSTLADLQPHIDRMDGFVQRIHGETAEETQAAREVHKQRLDGLCEEEARYVRANDSPSKNHAFAKVREDIDSIETLLKDTERQESEQAAFGDRWRALMEKMPRREPEPAAEPAPRKRKWSWMFLGRS